MKEQQNLSLNLKEPRSTKNFNLKPDRNQKEGQNQKESQNLNLEEKVNE